MDRLIWGLTSLIWLMLVYGSSSRPDLPTLHQAVKLISVVLPCGMAYYYCFVHHWVPPLAERLADDVTTQILQLRSAITQCAQNVTAQAGRGAREGTAEAIMRINPELAERLFAESEDNAFGELLMKIHASNLAMTKLTDELHHQPTNQSIPHPPPDLTHLLSLLEELRHSSSNNATLASVTELTATLTQLVSILQAANTNQEQLVTLLKPKEALPSPIERIRAEIRAGSLQFA